MTQFINLSHNDMDGAGSNIVLREKFPDMDSFHVGYNDIKETLQLISDDISYFTKVLFVTDLAFDVGDFNELMRIAESNPDLKIVYIDHHPYEEEAQEAFDELSSMVNVYTKHVIGKSATMLCYEFIKSDDEDLGKLVTWIDAYDIYKELSDPVNFKIGNFLNTIFWSIKMSGFKTNLINNDYKIPKFFKTLYKETIEDKNQYFEKLIKNGLVVFDDENSILLSFCDRHKSFWQMDYPEYEFYVLPYQSKSNNISVRIDNGLDDEWATIIKNAVINYAEKSPWLISAGGHHHAFGITLDKNMPKEDHLTFVSGIIDVLEGYNASARIPY